MAWLTLICIAAFLSYALGFEHRDWALRTAIHEFKQLKKAIAARRERQDPIRDALRERTPRVFVTPVLVAMNAMMFVAILFGAGSMGNPNTLLDWGGNFGPRTTNGEWWRLVASTFVHDGAFSLVINLIALWLIGSTVERLAGRWTMAVSYVAGGIFASLASVNSQPASVHTGAAGAIFGVAGALLASAVWNIWRPPSDPEQTPSDLPTPEDAERILQERLASVPFAALKILAPLLGVFIVVNMIAGGVSFAAELVGLIAGLASGLVLTQGISVALPDPQRVTTAAGATAVLTFAFAFPLRGIADVKPEIEKVMAIENRATAVYQPAFEKYTKGKMAPDALAQVIDRSIVPDIEAAEARLKALRKVPPEHQAIVADATDYLQLRRRSWQLRAISLRGTNKPMLRSTPSLDVASDATWRLKAEAQHRADMKTRGSVETSEREALVAFHKIKPVGFGPTP